MRNLSVALFPTPHFGAPTNDWWQGADRDFSWWLVWFAHYRTFILHHADMATEMKASALILGGDWLDPALPSGLMPDGSPSGVPADADARWRSIIAELRSRFSGNLFWALPAADLSQPPEFLDSVDGVYVLLSEPLAELRGRPLADLELEAGQWLDETMLPFQAQLGKPVLLGASFASPDLQVQAYDFQVLLGAVNARNWISGLFARGYYPAAPLQDASASTNGKPANQVLAYWFPRLLGKE
jgi:hypothetical protein